MPDLLTFAPLTELVDLLLAEGMEAVLDPSELNGPGAWVTVEQIIPSPVLQGGWQIDAVVFLIAPDIDHGRAADQLAVLFNQAVSAGLDPDGAVRPQGVILPGDPTVLPALRFPLTLFT
jgi:hypothetical protein